MRLSRHYDAFGQRSIFTLTIEDRELAGPLNMREGEITGSVAQHLEALAQLARVIEMGEWR